MWYHLLPFFFLSLTNGQRAKPGDFPWRFQFTVSNGSDTFKGVLKFDVYFDGRFNDRQSIVLVERTYDPGSSHVTLQKLTEIGGPSNGAPTRIVASAESNDCIPNRTVIISEIGLTSFHKRRTYRKVFNEKQLLLIYPRCNATNSTSVKRTVSIIENFQSIPSSDCYYQGEFYSANRSFSIGCNMECYCKDSMVECDSMCKPPSTPLSRNCRLASVDRKCCDETECMEDAIWDSCPIHIAARDRMPPWAVLLTMPETRDRNDTIKTCGASIIHKKLLITSAHCLQGDEPGSVQSAGSIFISGEGSSVIGRAKSVHVHPSYNGKDPEADLALIELAQDGLEFNENLRRVNLPWPSLCKRYVVPGCATQYTTVDQFDTFVGRVVPVSKFCTSSKVSEFQQPFTKSQPENGTGPLFCVQRMTEGIQKNSINDTGDTGTNCNQVGNGVVTKRAQYNYLIGVIAHDYGLKPIEEQYKYGTEPDKRLEQVVARSKRNEQKNKKEIDQDDRNHKSCHRQYMPATNLCPHIDWLKSTINEILDKEQ